MRAIVQSRYGAISEVLSIKDVAAPVPRAGHVLVRAHAASIHADVWHVVAGRPAVLRMMGAGLRRPVPTIPGTDVAGIVEAVGQGVSGLRLGDAVFGETHHAMQWRHGSSFAELVEAPEELLALKPRNVSFEQAATVPTSGIIAYWNLRDPQLLAANMRVLINGAGGAVGGIALQLAKSRGAEVTAVDKARKHALLMQLGATHCVDYEREDCTASPESFDLIVDVASTLELSQAKRILRPGGKYLRIGHDHYGRRGGRLMGSLPGFFGLMLRGPFDSALPKLDTTMPDKAECIRELARLMESGQLTPVVGASYPMEQFAEAFDDLCSGKTVGRIVLTMQAD